MRQSNQPKEMPLISLRLRWWFFLVNLVICISSLKLESLSSTPTFGNETDKLALLTIKHHLVDVPKGVLSSWNDSLHFCQWQGVTCSRRRQRVTALRLEGQSLGGSLPPIGNLTFLRELVLSNNLLHGTIPSDIGLLRRMRHLNLSTNSLQGEIPIELTNCSNLETVDLTRNNLTGQIPFRVGNMSTKLLVLRLGGNGLTGVIPSTLGNLSSLQHLSVSFNHLEGSIPHDLGRLKSLKILYLSVNNLSGQNYLTGVVPTSVGKLQKLVTLRLSWNRLSGLLPSSLGNLSQLFYLEMSNNNLEGNIPTSLRNCQNMEILLLDHNKLSGGVPENVIGHFNQLRSLYLQQNTFTGSLPADVGQLKNLNELLVSDNKLSGEIPTELGSCLVLEYLDMARNSFQGNIPLSFSSLRGIQFLDLSCNNLSGRIPNELEDLGLLSLNLSYNYLEGEVPSGGVFKNVSGISITGNNKLCGGIPQLQLPPCPIVASAKHGKGKHLSIKIIIAISIAGVSCLAFIVASVLFYRRKKTTMKSSSTSLGYGYLRVSYNELLKATCGFASSNLIGMGSFGSVYKGVLSQGKRLVAVKVLNLQQHGASKSFMAECKVLRQIRHRNLLGIITSCSSVDNKGSDFKALVFEFMPNGNLDSWLHHESRNLSFRQRLDIAIDVACALDYLHHHCQTPIVHGDLKPSNVLLDDNMVAHVGDFGLTKLIPEATEISSSDHQTGSALLMGSIGYVAPEYGLGGSMWPQGDMYSYGILLLEMFTGKRPTDHMFSDGLNLHSFSKMALLERVMEIADSNLVGESSEAINNIENHCDMEGRTQHCLASIARIGVACSEESPGDRLDIKDVVMELNIIKKVFLGAGIHGERHIRMQLPAEGTSQLGGESLVTEEEDDQRTVGKL
eukprot:XP_019077578.1 PREDICTED: putative receptor-like protein kinase At3g47110 isoform X2 [Vitis vinifera]